MNKFRGSGVALVTPFTQTGEVDTMALRKLVRLQVAGGTDFLVVQGTTGETSTLSDSEKQLVLETVIDENAGKLPVVLGAGGNYTDGLIKKLGELNLDGVDGLLSVSPYYNKPTQEGVYQHFKAISEATDKAIILYNVPGRTSSNVLAETTLRLTEFKNIVAVKEASGNMEQIMAIIQHAPAGFDVLSGDDALTVPMISVGAKGVISVVANALPERFSKMVSAALNDDWSTAREQHYALLEITKLFFAQGNPAGVKAALKERGIMGATLRLPLVNVTPELDADIAHAMRELV